MATGEPYDIEQRMRRADGVYRWFHVRGMPLRDVRGNVVRWYVVETDIDDRKRAEALLTGEKQLLEMAAAGQLDVGHTRGALPASRSGDRRMLLQRRAGRSERRASRTRSRAEPSGQLHHLDYWPSRECRFGSLRDGGVPERTSHCCRPRVGDAMGGLCVVPNGHGTWTPGVLVNADLVHDRQGRGRVRDLLRRASNAHAGTTGLIEQFTHIASIAIERAQSDAALKQSEARKAAILDSALDCIVTIDHEGCITEFNPAAERTFGYRRDEVVGKQLADVIIPPSLREKHRQGLARYLATGEARVIGQARRDDGGTCRRKRIPRRTRDLTHPAWTGRRPSPATCATSRNANSRRRSCGAARHFSPKPSVSARPAAFPGAWRPTRSRGRSRSIAFSSLTGVPVTLELIATRVHPEDIPLMHDMIDRAESDGRRLRIRTPAADARPLGQVPAPGRSRDPRPRMVNWSTSARFRT